MIGGWNIEIKKKQALRILFLELFHKKEKRKIISIKYNCINYRIKNPRDGYYLQRVMMISRFWLKNLK